MSFRLLHCVRPLPRRRVARLLRRPFPFVGMTAFALLALGSAFRGEAGPLERPVRTSVAAHAPTPSPTPRLKIISLPHLLAVGPMDVDIKPLAGPRVRRPPLLPPPKPAEPDPDATSTSPQPQEPVPPPPPEPSAFSPDAPPVLLPSEKPASTPAPEKRVEPRENVLVPADRGEPDLKDAVMYFDTPVGPRGSRASIPIPMPFGSPAPAPLPESRATYRKEKE
jgi:hypothetical protein